MMHYHMIYINYNHDASVDLFKVGARYLILIMTRNIAAMKITDIDNVQKILRKQTADIYDDRIETGGNNESFENKSNVIIPN